MGVIPFYGAGDPAMFALERRAMDRDGLVIVALEPERGMIARAAPLTWVQGDAERMPFRSATFDAAYATWAYFFSRDWDPTPGIAELDRVVVRGGPLAIVDNLGGDGFAAMAETDISADPSFWLGQGFEVSVIDTAFRFEDLQDAEALLGFFFGDRGRRGASTEVGFRVGLFSRVSRGA